MKYGNDLLSSYPYISILNPNGQIIITPSALFHDHEWVNRPWSYVMNKITYYSKSLNETSLHSAKSACSPHRKSIITIFLHHYKEVQLYSVYYTEQSD